MDTTEMIHKSRWFINRNFTLLWIGRTISITGDFFFSTTMILWFTTSIARGQSWAPLAISGVALAETIPTLVVGPIAGVFVDRWDKRRTMLVMDVLRTMLIALLLLTAGLVVPPLFGNGQVSLAEQLASIYTVIVLASICAQFFNPARSALVRDIVPAEQLTKASSSWGLFLLIFARMTSFLPGLILFALLGLANAGSNVVVGPLKWRVTPREFIGRVEAAFMPTIIASQLVSVTIAGYLTGMVLNGLHTTFLGMTFTPVDTIFTAAGILALCAGVYALAAMRDMKIEQAVDRR